MWMAEDPKLEGPERSAPEPADRWLGPVGTPEPVPSPPAPSAKGHSCSPSTWTWVGTGPALYQWRHIQAWGWVQPGARSGDRVP